VNQERVAELLKQLAAELAVDLTDAHHVSALRAWIDTNLYADIDRSIAFTDVYASFKRSLPENLKGEWSKARVLAELGNAVVLEGRKDQPRKMVRGFSWHAPPAPPPPPPVIDPAAKGYDHKRAYRVAKEMHDAGRNVGWICTMLAASPHELVAPDGSDYWKDRQVRELLGLPS
jgi:hypothetical protein